MARMLGRIGWIGCTYEDWPYSWHRTFRQRQRARERAALGRELVEDMPLVSHDLYCLDELSACYDGMCECDCHGDQDWKRGGENAMILELMARVDGVPFDGTYTVGP